VASRRVAMSNELLTFQMTVREAKAVHNAASMFLEGVEEMLPEFGTHLEPDGSPPALTSGILALETTLMLT
jgi:hypothetical protein